MKLGNRTHSAVVVGGSNGIGLAIAVNLMKKGYFVYILDMLPVDERFSEFQDQYEHISYGKGATEICVERLLATK